MSIIDAIAGKRRGGRQPIPTGPERAPAIADKIAAVRQELAGLDRDYSAAALAVVEGEEGAVERLDAIKAQRAALGERIVDLEAAHAVALEADNAMRAAQRAAMNRTNILRVKRLLADRDDAARRLQVALENAAAAWRDLWTASRAAQQANPPGAVWPEPSLCNTHQLVRAVSIECWRLRGKHPQIPDSDAEPAAFPLGKPINDVDVSPTKQPALLDEIAKADEWIISQLEGRKPNR